MPLTPETWLAEFTANTVTAGSQFEPRIVQLSNGNILVAWTSDANTGAGSPGGTDIISQLFDPFGNPIGIETRLNGFFADNERSFDIAALENGRFVVVYEDENGSAANQSIRFNEWGSDDTGIIFGTQGTILDSAEAGDIVSTPTVAANTDGSYVVGIDLFDASAGHNTLVIVKVETDGTVGPLIVSGLVGSSLGSDNTDSALLTDGNVVTVTEFSVGDPSIAINLFNPLEGDSTPGFAANTASNGDTDRNASVVALTGGGFVVAWENVDGTDTEILFQIYANDGTPISGLRRVGSASPNDLNSDPELVALPDGGFILFWDDTEAGAEAGRGVRLDSAGSQVGGFFTFAFPNGGREVSATALDDGRVALVWTDGDIGMSIIDTRDAPNTVLGTSGVQTGTIGNDVFTAAGRARIVNGWDGNDRIIEGSTPFSTQFLGGTGDDIIIVTSGIGSDSFDGGIGNDTINWAGVTDSGVTFNLAAGIATDGSETEVMVNFENLSGTNNADTIIGTSAGNNLLGNGGNDFIDGVGGADILIGGLGNDTLQGGAGDDFVNGGNGDDTLSGGTDGDTVNGGSGNDLILILDNEFIDVVDGGTGIDTLDLSDIVGTGEEVSAVNGGTFQGFGGVTSITGIEEIIGTQEGDVLIGFDIARGGLGDDTIEGRENSQMLFGDAGNDLFTVGAGQFVDSVDGGTGNDTLDHSNLSAVDFNGAIVDFGLGLLTDNFASGGSVTLTSIEHYIDNDGGNDITAAGPFMRVFAQGGDDTVREGSDEGGEIFDLGSGDDLLEINNSSLGDDVFTGGIGDDTVSFENLTSVLSNLVIDLDLGTAASGSGATDTLIDFENVIGSQVSERIMGTDDGANRIDGRDGDDTIDGRGGDDILNGENGNDLITGGRGNDTLIGGIGNDTIDGGVGNDRVEGADGADNMSGGSGNDLLLGGIGADVMSGGDDNDTIAGGNDNDIADGGNGDDLLYGNGGEDTLNGEDGADEISGGDGADLVLGGSGSDTLRGANQDDRLEGGADDDVMAGNSGNDRVYGGSGNDRLFGGNGDDTLLGEGGEDSIFGGSSNDTVSGGDDNDRVMGGNGNDLLFGNNGNDTLDGEDGADEISGGNGADLVFGRSGEDTLRGANGNDRIFAGADDDLVAGNSGNDTLEGGSGDDRLFGGNDNDVINGGKGIDFLSGGAGQDVFVFESVGDSPHGSSRDAISDFTHGIDQIDLSGVIDGLSFIGVSSFTNNAGEVRYNDSIGRLYIDTDGNGASDFSVDLTGIPIIDSNDLIL